jgi:hypothetical protein
MKELLSKVQGNSANGRRSSSVGSCHSVVRIGSFACFGVAMESAASKCANAR